MPESPSKDDLAPGYTAGEELAWEQVPGHLRHRGGAGFVPRVRAHGPPRGLPGALRSRGDVRAHGENKRRTLQVAAPYSAAMGKALKQNCEPEVKI